MKEQQTYPDSSSREFTAPMFARHMAKTIMSLTRRSSLAHVMSTGRPDGENRQGKRSRNKMDCGLEKHMHYI